MRHGFVSVASLAIALGCGGDSTNLPGAAPGADAGTQPLVQPSTDSGTGAPDATMTTDDSGAEPVDAGVDAGPDPEFAFDGCVKIEGTAANDGVYKGCTSKGNYDAASKTTRVRPFSEKLPDSGNGDVYLAYNGKLPTSPASYPIKDFTNSWTLVQTGKLTTQQRPHYPGGKWSNVEITSATATGDTYEIHGRFKVEYDGTIKLWVKF